jgi:hypothetical protein
VVFDSTGGKDERSFVMNYYAIDRKFMQEEPAIYVPMSIVDEQDWPKNDIDSLNYMLMLLEEESPEGCSIRLSGFRIARFAQKSEVSELWGYMLLAKAVDLNLITLMPSASFVSSRTPRGRLNYTVDARHRAGLK